MSFGGNGYGAQHYRLFVLPLVAWGVHVHTWHFVRMLGFIWRNLVDV